MPCRLGISSMSLGRANAGHLLSHKLDMAQKHGYHGIELFYDDLVDLANQLADHHQKPPSSSHDSQLLAAAAIRDMCAARGLTIICLQPFSHYEGLVDRKAHGRRIDELRFWIKLAHVLGTDIVQIPSTFLPAAQVTEDLDLIVADLREAADIGLQQRPVMRFAYESLGWGTRVNTWEQCWDVIQRVDRPNFGMCLDTFNIACAIYADPTSPSGRVARAEDNVAQSMARLVRTVDLRKVFYVQVVDGQRLDAPLVPGHPLYTAEQVPRLTWSRNCRLFYGEQSRGGYLPVKEIAAAIFQGLGFDNGWVSLELFNARMSDVDASVPEELASRGARSWAKLVKDMNLVTERPAAELVPAML